MVSSEISHYCPTSRSPHWAHWKEPQSDVGGESRAAPDPGALSSPTRERLWDGSPVVPLRSRARVCAQERVLQRAVDDRQSPPAAPGRRAECSPSPVRVPLRPSVCEPTRPTQWRPAAKRRSILQNTARPSCCWLSLADHKAFQNNPSP